MTLVGYARVSTAKTTSRKEQHVDNQAARLLAAGVAEENLYVDDGVSGKLRSRPRWDACLAFLRDGDVLAVTKLDRIGRSLINLVDTLNLLHQHGVQLRCLDQAIDTTTPNGKLMFHILSALAEWEASMARERTLEGLAAAKERHGGSLPVRGPSVSPDKLATARELATVTDMSAGRIAEVIGVSRATLYRHIDIAGIRQQAAAS